MSTAAETVDNFHAAADALESAVADLRSEAEWIDRNHPLREWSDETAASYLASSRGSREYNMRQAAAKALGLLATDDDPELDMLARAISRGSIR